MPCFNCGRFTEFARSRCSSCSRKFGNKLQPCTTLDRIHDQITGLRNQLRRSSHRFDLLAFKDLCHRLETLDVLVCINPLINSIEDYQKFSLRLQHHADEVRHLLNL